jgi:hypothetical protein
LSGGVGKGGELAEKIHRTVAEHWSQTCSNPGMFDDKTRHFLLSTGSKIRVSEFPGKN